MQIRSRHAILGLRDAGYKYAIWVASAAHPGYIEFARRHIAPIAISVSEMVRMTKRLESA